MTKLRFFQPGQRARAARGFTLVELMVSLVIGMGLIITMGLLSNKFETAKRESASSSDMSSTSAFLSYDIDRQIRSAGSGFSTSWSDTYGCELTASRNSAQALPAPAAFPEPFASVPQSIRMVPLVVYPVAAAASATGSDVIQVMTGTGGVGEVPNPLRTKSVATNIMRLTSTVGIQADDLLLITDAGRPCMLEQVSASYTGTSDQVDLAGAYYAAVINGQALNDRATGASYAKSFIVGNATNNNPPRFNLLGVNASNQLVRYDLLNFGNGGASSTEPVPLADGVMMMRVRYGIDSTGDGIIDSWVRPDAVNYTATDITTNQARARQVIAVKISMVLRSDTIEDQSSNTNQSTTRSTYFVAPPTLRLFSSLGSALQDTYTVADRQRRHNVVEFTVPLRNVLASVRTAIPS
ncbi:type IV pilus assembly protein PilW [Roseateles sp. YR242]|uniref:PilW family protein n=1 Tax=Roseateles sp. YR242 TaxID=1855305 RepID=UPI0008AF2BCF|nr:PilW family protein [Roseateles sp. YR242]SEL69226.1 type IV pilus assembly protein PilW [Roseateles sp. YR242]